MLPDKNEKIEDILREEGILSDTGDATSDRPTKFDEPTLDIHPKTVSTDSYPPASSDEQCVKCNKNQTRVTCPLCKGPYCQDCASILDPKFCKDCLNEPAAQITINPLKDPDGVSHEGRDMQPTGPYFGSLCKRISEMSVYQLEAHIDYYKDLIRQAELSLDFRRTVLGASQIELAQRKDAERRRLRGVKVPHVKGPTLVDGKITTKAPDPKAKRDPVKDLGAALGVNPAQMSAILAAIFTKKPPATPTTPPSTTTKPPEVKPPVKTEEKK
jgi:hypothetical protein